MKITYKCNFLTSVKKRYLRWRIFKVQLHYYKFSSSIVSEEWIASSYLKLVCYLSASLSALYFIFSDIEIAERIWKEVLLLSNNPCYIRKLFINFYGQVLKVNMELKEYLRMVTRKKLANFKSWTSFITVQHIGNYISMVLWLGRDECSFTMGLNIFEI